MNPTQPASMAVTEFDSAPAADAAAELVPCCASKRWVAELVTGRPYRGLEQLFRASDECLARLDWSDIAEALTAHPRIGDRATGSQREAAWSRQEQSGAAVADAEVARELAAGNAEYEARFDQVFLICATGLTAAEMLAGLRFRLGNDEAAERRIVRTELAKIVRLRLAKAFR